MAKVPVANGHLTGIASHLMTVLVPNAIIACMTNMEDIRQQLVELVQGGRNTKEIIAAQQQRRAERAGRYAGVISLLSQAMGLLEEIREDTKVDHQLISEAMGVATHTFDQSMALSSTPPFGKVSEHYARIRPLIGQDQGSRLRSVSDDLYGEEASGTFMRRYVKAAIEQADGAIQALGATSEPVERLNNHVDGAEASISRYAERAGLGEIV